MERFDFKEMQVHLVVKAIQPTKFFLQNVLRVKLGSVKQTRVRLSFLARSGIAVSMTTAVTM